MPLSDPPIGTQDDQPFKSTQAVGALPLRRGVGNTYCSLDHLAYTLYDQAT